MTFQAPIRIHITQRETCHHGGTSTTFSSEQSFEVAKMHNTTDLYLGTFLILCGFALSLFNLRRVLKGGVAFSNVLLSENILLMCIGIAFVSRSVYSMNPTNVEVYDMEERAIELVNFASGDVRSCGFSSLLLGYGPLVVSMVNSFLTLIIDNYMHYKMLGTIKKKIHESAVHEVGEETGAERKINYGIFRKFWKRYFSFISIALQWIVPVLFALAMYPMSVKEISISQARSMEESCMALLDLKNNECYNITDITNYTVDLPKFLQSPVNFIPVQETNGSKSDDSDQIDSVLSNVLRIINNFNNHTNFTYATIKSPRQPKMDEKCMKMCYTDNKSLLLYMFILAFASYFIPITISTVILTKIHVMDVRHSMKTHVTRELLYNILFWTPVMFDTFLSLIFCSYSTHGLRTSMINVIANIYQAVKNFMNTKYFKENVVVPV